MRFGLFGLWGLREKTRRGRRTGHVPPRLEATGG